MKSTLLFAFDDHDIRVVRNENGEPWFVASDVCGALDIGNVTMALERLDADDLSSTEVMDSTSRLQKTRIISQSGLFELVAGSRKPQAKPFRKWVFGTVLPSIAKTSSGQDGISVTVALPQSDEVSSEPMFLSDQFEAYLKIAEMELDGRVQRLVDLRSLHEKLGVKRDFTHWVKDALTNSKSTEGVDFSHVVRDVRRERGATQRHDYYASFEVTKIIAARSNTDSSIDICRWLVRVEEQVRAKQVAAPQLSRLEMARELVAALEREEAAREEAARLTHTIASNTLYPKVEPEPNKAHISIRDIKREFAPYLAEPKIRLVLRFYGQGRTRFQFGSHENAAFQTFQREGLEEVFSRFLEDATIRISSTKSSVIIDHECFDSETARISREVAIEHLGFFEEDFEG